MQGWEWSSQALLFVDEATLLTSKGTELALVDVGRRVVVDTIRLASARVPDRSDHLAKIEDLEQDLYGARWSWDAARRTIVGVGYLRGHGQVASGLGVWMPGLQPVPVSVSVPVAGTGQRPECSASCTTATPVVSSMRSAS